MSHVETWQKTPGSYPFNYQLETRFQDVDMLGHINNVAMAALFESGRVRFNSGYDDSWSGEGRRALIASITINYLAESYYPEPIRICCGISRIGNTSWRVAQAGFQCRKNGASGDRSNEELLCVAAGSATLVLTGEEGNIALPDKLREALKARSVIKADS